MAKKRVIEVREGEIRRWYYLSPDAPSRIKDRDELMKWSLGRGAPNPYGKYEVEERPDLGR
jgi:hypothetical protein